MMNIGVTEISPRAVQQVAERDDGGEEATDGPEEAEQQHHAAVLVLVGPLLLDDLDELAFEPLDPTGLGLAHAVNRLRRRVRSTDRTPSGRC